MRSTTGDVRLAPGKRAAHARAQVAAGEVLHRQVDVVVGDTQVEDTRDVRVVETRRQVVLAQESVEGRAAVRNIRHLPEHLEDPGLPDALDFGKEHARGTADGYAADAAITADPHRTEAVGRRRLERRARGAGENVVALGECSAQCSDELLVIELEARKATNSTMKSGR